MAKFKVLRNLIRLIASIMSLVGFGMMFLYQVRITNRGELSFIDTFFGSDGTFIPLIGYGLMLASAVVCFIFIDSPMLEEQKRFIYYAISAVLVIAALLVFTEGALITAMINEEGVSARLLSPPIIAGTLAIVSALGLSFAEISTKHKKENI